MDNATLLQHVEQGTGQAIDPMVLPLMMFFGALAAVVAWSVLSGNKPRDRGSDVPYDFGPVGGDGGA